MSSAKRAHTLHRARDAAAFLEALKREGVDLTEVLAGYLPSGHRADVILVGSLAEGVANAASDVDLMVLVESRAAVRTTGADLGMQAGRAVEYLLYRNGVEINLEIFVREDVERLMHAFVSIAPALYDPAGLRNIPLLQPYDLRFLHRLRTGWSLLDTGLAEMWRDELMVQLLPTYLTVLNINGFDEHFEDAASMLPDNPSACILIGRICVECGMLAVLAHAGYTNQNRKWLLHWCDLAAEHEVGALLARGRELLLKGCRDAGAPDYLRDVGTFGRDVVDCLSGDPEIARAVGYLRQRITYVPAATAL